MFSQFDEEMITRMVVSKCREQCSVNEFINYAIIASALVDVR